MPVLWPASQKPMYIRTVWVGGFRHAVLSEDDPYYVKRNKRRPHSSTTCTSKHNSSRSRRQETLEDCLKKLNLAINTNRTQNKSDDFDIEHLDLNDVEDIVIKANQQPLCEYDTNRIKFSNLDNMKTLRSNRTARTEVKENTELSDRVLQWLDLAGKIDLLAPDNVERMSQPRHSWPEIQGRNQSIVKSKTAVDLRVKSNTSKVIDSAREQPNVNIDRHDFYMPTSANTIETYARRSRNAKSTPSPGNHARIKTDKNKPNLQTNVLETRKRLATERNAVEKQYTDLVNKKIIPDLGKSTKKQVHIFMPESISKKINSNTTSRSESLLTQRS